MNFHPPNDLKIPLAILIPIRGSSHEDKPLDVHYSKAQRVYEKNQVNSLMCYGHYKT